MFVRFFRILTHRRITFDKNKTSKNKRVTLEILVPKSKTDQHREGNIVYISRVSSECCPVNFLEKYLQKANIEISKDCETPLIGRIFKTKKRHKTSKTQGISYSRIREVLKDYITDITANPEKYGLHSLRAGGTSAAANNGVTG